MTKKKPASEEEIISCAIMIHNCNVATGFPGSLDRQIELARRWYETDEPEIIDYLEELDSRGQIKDGEFMRLFEQYKKEGLPPDANT